jgi:hypothetical protein
MSIASVLRRLPHLLCPLALVPAMSACASRAATGGDGGGSSTSPGGVVHACSALPAPGTWENITPPALLQDGGIGNVPSIVADPSNPGVLFAGGGPKSCCGNGSMGFWKSTDCGATWTKLNVGTNGAELDTGWQWSVRLTPYALFVTNGYGQPPTLFKSTNGTDWSQAWGTEISQYLQYDFAQQVSVEAGDPMHLAVSMHENCLGAFAPICIAESTDGGSTWHMIKAPGTGWQEGATAIPLGPGTILYAMFNDPLFYTNDDGETWEQVGPNGSGGFYVSPSGTMYMGTANGLAHSADGHAWSYYGSGPPLDVVLGDGQTVYASNAYDMGGQPIYTAPESDPSTWTQMKTPPMKSGGSAFAYDAAHHVLYSANWEGGLWRYVTP